MKTLFCYVSVCNLSSTKYSNVSICLVSDWNLYIKAESISIWPQCLLRIENTFRNCCRRFHDYNSLQTLMELTKPIISTLLTDNYEVRYISMHQLRYFVLCLLFFIYANKTFLGPELYLIHTHRCELGQFISYSSAADSHQHCIWW